MPDWHDEHEAFKKNIGKVHAQNTEREAKAADKAEKPSLTDRLREKLQDVRGREGGKAVEKPEQARQQAPARPTPAKDRER